MRSAAHIDLIDEMAHVGSVLTFIKNAVMSEDYNHDENNPGLYCLLDMVGSRVDTAILK